MPEPSTIDRRESNRVTFGSSVKFTEYDGQTLPNLRHLRSATAEDLSHTGLAFRTPDWPATDKLLLALTKSGERVLVTAQIVGVAGDLESSPPTFRIRCHFLNWLRADT